MRVATVDIGTNTVLLLVAEVRDGGELTAVAERAEITRLGEGVDRTRRLAPAALERTISCLDGYAAVVAEADVDRTAVVATSAMRDAAGGDVLHDRIRERFGVELRVVSGDEEARLTFLGSLSGLGIEVQREVVVFDIGGGSTEIVRGHLDAHGDAHVGFACSYDVGSVRLTERHRPRDPPRPEELEAIRRSAREAFAGLPDLTNAAAGEPVGIAGTMTTLAAVSLGLSSYDGRLVHGHRMTIAELERVVTRLASMTLEMRCRTPGLQPKRADVIVAGGLLALEVAARLRARGIRISDRGVRWGLAAELAQQRPE